MCVNDIVNTRRIVRECLRQRIIRDATPTRADFRVAEVRACYRRAVTDEDGAACDRIPL